jgi:hypothetical protein
MQNFSCALIPRNKTYTIADYTFSDSIFLFKFIFNLE